MLNPVVMRSDLLFSLRDTLRAEAFVEVTTPTMRRADLGPGRRLPVDHDGGRFLRAMIGPALRVNLEHHRRIFEIGACFRPEKPDELHAPEFQMLDLYAAGEDFDFLLTLAERLIGPHLPYALQRVSVAGHVRDQFGIDLRREPLGDLPAQMAAHLGMSAAVPFKTVLGQYVEREVEVQSTGAALFLTEYPVGGDEPCARLAPGTTAVLNRFEVLVDGIEVVHGYEDEPDGAAFVDRARAVDLYDDEQALAREAIDSGRVPATSVGLGIGIERLCMAASGVKDIRVFQPSLQF
ncbi:amino acid--tRNA ligase-related protein [Streptomyces mutabilis]|uniref:Lysyl-tRNA synthetase n=1 Tax=Streptomyces mutabilis TaxID=67332 RepID=A0A086MR98_9ACTN|nr:amino acid--tRNA ligase-related protein [Streptomyces mutabilis]KFG71416.1 lysyl-tRNA synthetase [Streptomyces mutabilis]